MVVSVLLAALSSGAYAQMQMGGEANTLEENVARHTGSGTSLEPGATVPPMLMAMHGSWMLMLHGEVGVVEQQQSGPRGADKLFSVNWLMPMAQRSTQRSNFTARAMLSLEPATISGRYYPELFQQGETAFGKPIVDGQHPHDLFMELAAMEDYKVGKHALATLYAALVGDPAMGPEAFPHRASAEDNPLAPLAHHLQDSTHIAYDVLTGGVAVGPVKVEASGFHGREPGENRWTIHVGALDSWSARLWVAPSRNWLAQYSVGHLVSPEALRPDEDLLRQTASIAAHWRWDAATLDATAVWGRNHTIGSAVNANGYLLEGEVKVRDRHFVWMRAENDDRTTDLLGAGEPEEEAVIGRVQAYTGGYAHRILANEWSSWELGAQATFYSAPPALAGLYGSHPVGVAVVLHGRIGH